MKIDNVYVYGQVQLYRCIRAQHPRQLVGWT